jgi:hypothetical protein
LWDLRGASGISASEADWLVYASIERIDANPTFQEYRDAMIAEDNSAYSGQHGCTIKEAFADRGIGSLCTPSVQITSGPIKVTEGETATWEASVSGGSGFYSISWKKQRKSGDSWLGTCGTSLTCTTSFRDTDD